MYLFFYHLDKFFNVVPAEIKLIGGDIPGAVVEFVIEDAGAPARAVSGSSARPRKNVIFGRFPWA